jgi:ABC-2 type transport system permease protein
MPQVGATAHEANGIDRQGTSRIEVLGLAVTSPGWHRHLQQIAPMTAGLEIQASTGLSHLPISPWAGLGVLAAWAAAALVAGGLMLCLRDA